MLGLCGSAAGAYALLPQQSPNAAPVFTEGASATRQLAENSEGGYVISGPVSATDADGHRLTYSLGGEDADAFAFDSRNGQLRSLDGVVYDHEVKARYAVTIRAEDGHGGHATIAVAVELTDEREPPAAPDRPRVVSSTATSLTVSWTPPANSGSPLRGYEGQYRAAGESGFTLGWDRVGTVTEATIGELDRGTSHEVQVRAVSAEGAGEWSESLTARTAENQAPVFEEGASTTRQIEENSAAGENVGAPVTAADADGDEVAYALEQPEQTPFHIDTVNGQLMTRGGGATLDFETQPEHPVTVRVEDGHGGSATTVITIFLLDVAEPTLVADAGRDLEVAAGETAWLDGTASSGEGVLTYSWSLVSWAGDSQPELDDPATATPSFEAAAEGTYVVRLTVSQGGLSAADDVAVVARPSTETAALVRADLLVDANRDGVVDLSDETGEDSWDTESGAVFGPNADDDDLDGIRDAWDSRANGDEDLLDMSPVVARQIPGLHREHTVVVGMISDSSPGAQLFYKRADGEIELLIASGDEEAELPLDQLAAGDVSLYLESRNGRSAGFDGRLSLTLTVEDDGTEVAHDSVAFRGSPILFSHHLQSVERVFVVDIPSDWEANGALVNALETRLPASIDLYAIVGDRYRSDRWVQDSMQTGYVQRPSAEGVEAIAVHAQLHRGRGLKPFLPDEYLSGDEGFNAPGGQYYSSYNYGGNVEVIPPHTHDGRTFSYGRVIVGGGPEPDSQAMAGSQLDFINAQEVQGPALVVDTSWLLVSHVDELFTVLPNRNAGEDERPWVVAIGSPDLAIELLEEAVEAGYGDAPIFEGRDMPTHLDLEASDETTPQEMLADMELLTINETAQARMDTLRDVLIAEVGLGESDFREVPALFFIPRNGLMAALIPNIQNLLVANNVLLVPDPEGPTVDGVDIWRQATLDAVDGLGLTTHFVDVYWSYHLLLGALHCGVNSERAGSVVPWWLDAGTGGQ